ncbi:ComEC/Rec2 family competence protein [Kiritimatiella glycovorans]|uniref:ComEC family competence protein n=1 Tax=Kiritimatiella glycovorans TaxID=1307763 RepID=A0A0G3ED55_9BACT|nr:ComEC/Rec2 family competence protein [Kiritimatiella glycovorans]AKJ64253.1 ComEC family competence protein [Kiritimatiella glycovorans]
MSRIVISNPTHHAVARRPLAGLTISFISGLWLASVLTVPICVCCVAGALLLLAALRLPAAAANAALALAVICVAMARGGMERENRPELLHGAYWSRGRRAEPGPPAAGIREGAAEILRLGLEPHHDEHVLLQALLLGKRDGLGRDRLRVYERTGTRHIFALSGLHTGLLSLLFITLLRSAGVGRKHWIFLLAPLLAGFLAVTGVRPSASRAALMALLYWGAPALRRRPDPWSAVALAAMIVLMVDPGQLGSPGFILSFVAVTGILACTGRLNEAFRRSGIADSFRYVPGAVTLLSVSLGAWIALAPFCAAFFGRLCPAAPLINTCILPVITLVVLAGVLSLTLGWFWPLWAEVYNHAAGVLIGAVDHLLARAAEMPGICCAVAPPSATDALLWYSGWGMALFASRPAVRRQGAGLVMLAVVATAIRGLLGRMAIA